MRTSSALEQGQTIELLDQGETALKAGRLDEAEKHISQVLLENPENARAVALMKQIQDIRHKTQ
jgi:Flp pilus assembly protein TadD